MACGKEIKKVYGERESDERERERVGNGGKAKAEVCCWGLDGSELGVINTVNRRRKKKRKSSNSIFPLKISYDQIKRIEKYY